MEHKLINGGEEWLPFARSRIKALRATGLKYATQKFEIDDCSVRVQLVGDQEFIWIEGGQLNVWAYPSVVFPTSLNPDGMGGYVGMKNLPDKAKGKLRIGQNATPLDSGPPSFRKYIVVSAVSPYSTNSLTVNLSDVSNLNLAGADIRSMTAYAGRDKALEYPGVYTTSPAGPSPTSFVADGYATVTGNANATEKTGIVLAKVSAIGGLSSGSVTLLSMSTDLILLRSERVENAVTARDGSTQQELRQTVILSEASNSSGNGVILAGEGTTVSGRRYFSGSQTDKYSRCAYSTSPDGSIFMVVQRTQETGIYTGEGSDQKGEAVGTKTSSLYRVSASGSSKRLLSTTTDSYKAWADYRGVTRLEGKPRRVIAVMPGAKKIGIVYQNIFDFVEYWLDIIETKEYLIEKQIPVPAWPGTFTSKLDGGAGFVGKYMWCTGFCLNGETGKFLEIPNSMKPSTALTVPGDIYGICDYLLVSKDGKKATYYWLNISEAKRPFVTSGGNAHPLKDGHLRSYEIKEIDGVETVVDVSPSPNTKIIGTNKILSGDTNGAALLFKKGGGK